MGKKFWIAISNIQNVLKIWHMRNLNSECKIIVFKMLAWSKIVYLCFTSGAPKKIWTKLKIYRNVSFRTLLLQKLNSVLFVILLQHDLRNFDINTKITSLQCCWIKRLNDANFHEWKLIPLHLINAFITFVFKFHPSIALNFQLGQFPKFYQNIFHFLSTCFRFYSSVCDIIRIFIV